MKKQIRILGFDDGPFDKFSKTKKYSIVVGTFYRGGDFLDGVLSTKVTIDGDDATENIRRIVQGCKWKSLVQAILLDGIAVAGFNIIDINLLSERLGIPVIVVMRNIPDTSGMQKALKNIGMTKKFELIKKAGEITEHPCGVFFQYAGCTKEFTRDIITLTTRNAKIPEPLRVAHIIAAGIVKGESRGKS